MVEKPNTLYKTRDVAVHFGVMNRTVIDWVRKGKLTAIRLSTGQYRITGESFQKLVRPAPKKRAR